MRGLLDRPDRLRLIGCGCGLLIAPLAGIVASLSVVAIDAVAEDRQVISQVQQPASVRYPDGVRHVAGVRSVRSWLFRRHEPYELVVGSSLSYGHVLRLDIAGGPAPVIAGATWDANGVRVRLRSGHEVFVPARYFLNGR
ncbi:MAG TPA: hypothetical protein VH912_19105 [Streptosporangiaceae bacterium]